MELKISAQDDFMNDYFETTEPSCLFITTVKEDYPFHRTLFGSYVKCKPNENGSINIEYITSYVNRGGNRALKHLINLADKHKVVLEGRVLPFNDFPNITLDRLKKWYLRYGGVCIDGKDKIRREPR